MNQLGRFAQVSRLAEDFSVENMKNQFQSLQTKLSTLRSPQEFFNVKNMSKPQNVGDLQNRVSFNLNHYSSNYALIIGLLSIYTLLTNLLLLFVIILVFFGIAGINRLRGQDLVTPLGTFKTSQLYTALLCLALPLGFLASPISTMLWLIGASAVTVFGHAALMEKPVESVFDEETV
ncbi:Yip3p NDAI_0D01230 [Naumovozyma dairenensis CBS 421]|uniref:PRA1 family protein n=1 Tax=Naumovozyma dairenensis (strain ATCC 10597 / BCRC 20456 / CBS 421 / NBRC 0211 / NRRL Y-12639) TaxID=1071378 RepID=G0W9H6_NAUDC|nr:hypothetical protein NDAI_0D01230 [Naumovozyma dairenensis CBS 421]CCD24437.1 hypothetical protein NDAI_0D01230 [Naumovozyma dairenensis CBS 421]